ncbi:Dihydroorotase [Koleobacter methoxysyntrophicus]|uniref:Dihydroorotase n=1 Tax=Koleobacter methoxysyntrophicus TaxID=2751313 RepID=A0A8A0RLW1_9FIRM|nr:dihydroorotase [Koleobacter methoxysyntrophicus]QSQ08764.1 Dihydroorotase [Koleobacter methoxysyntrophicus]
MKRIIKGGRVVDPSQNIDGIFDILIDDGLIKAVDRNLSIDGAEIIEAKGMIVTPGLIDIHVHLREPGYEAKEDIESGSMAAAAGGFTSVACMPNTNPVVDNKSVVEFIKEKAKRVGIVNVYPIGAISKGLKGEELSEIGDMKGSGIVGISDDGKPVMASGLMRRAMEYAGMFDLPVISHCEDLDMSGDGVINEGLVSTILGLKGISKAAEEIMVARDIRLAELTGGRLHIAHVSTKGSVELIRQAKRRGIKVTAEATPHHFTLTDEAVRTFDTNTKVNPPLRSSEDVEAVREGLKDGTIDVIATDHAPHTLEDKDVEYDYASFGISGLETSVPLVITNLVHTGILTLSQAVEKMAVNPAQVINIPKGTLRPGSDADLTIIDIDRTVVIDTAKFKSKGKNSPFNGLELKGAVMMTLKGGNIVYNRNKVI